MWEPPKKNYDLALSPSVRWPQICVSWFTQRKEYSKSTVVFYTAWSDCPFFLSQAVCSSRLFLLWVYQLSGKMRYSLQGWLGKGESNERNLLCIYTLCPNKKWALVRTLSRIDPCWTCETHKAFHSLQKKAIQQKLMVHSLLGHSEDNKSSPDNWPTMNPSVRSVTIILHVCITSCFLILCYFSALCFLIRNFLDLFTLLFILCCLLPFILCHLLPFYTLFFWECNSAFWCDFIVNIRPRLPTEAALHLHAGGENSQMLQRTQKHHAWEDNLYAAVKHSGRHSMERSENAEVGHCMVCCTVEQHYMLHLKTACKQHSKAA